MDSRQVRYIQAPHEADEVCARMMKQGKAHYCMSDDMDMFVYGCNRVFRHLSLVNHNVIAYDFSAMLDDLGMDIQTFREIAVLSGTDYNCVSQTSLSELFELFELYKKYKQSVETTGFYNWVLHNTDCTSECITDYAILISIVKMFDIANYTDNSYILENIEQVSFGEIDMPALQSILEKDGFVFIQ
jgi:hypothetical protein